MPNYSTKCNKHPFSEEQFEIRLRQRSERKMLWTSISCSNGYEFEQIIRTIYVVAYEIYGDSRSHDLLPHDKKHGGLVERSQEVVNLLSDCRRKTDELIMEIPQVSQDQRFMWCIVFERFTYPLNSNPWSFNMGGNGVHEKELSLLGKHAN
ncbi:OLC1v1019180C1 [Oldenlandia corymbosa var. corymbosa]|uniref:OLC1v1019180C1 n=1 Tax=Oldenlandia corymbosa var. corymbosa TaxID=529605 RepID=A0AAV1EDF8_OLDCO|nr:OLC1v1019180C1 [Oldenlandia corymbosa var. corymbosa]